MVDIGERLVTVVLALLIATTSSKQIGFDSPEILDSAGSTPYLRGGTSISSPWSNATPMLESRPDTPVQGRLVSSHHDILSKPTYTKDRLPTRCGGGGRIARPADADGERSSLDTGTC